MKCKGDSVSRTNNLDTRMPMSYSARMDEVMIPATFWRECGLPDTAIQRLARLGGLHTALVEANARDNLTRITDEREFWLRHVADSLLVGQMLPALMTDPLTVADVGCGGGFPILPLACVNPELRITGIEARGKKAAFVASQIEALGATGATVVAMQAREAGRHVDHAGRYGVVLLRAVGEAGKMLREVRQLLSAEAGSCVIHYKTPESVEAEWDVARREAEKFGLGISQSQVVHLPHGAGERQFIIMIRP